MNDSDDYKNLGRAPTAAGLHMMQTSPRADELISCLEGEIAKRDARIVELEECLPDAIDVIERLRAELAAIKAQEPVAFAFRYDDGSWHDVSATQHSAGMVSLYAAPVSEAKAQGEYGDAYKGAREDLAIWKRRALEAEKALQEERIITEQLGNALNEENGPTFMGEPVLPTKTQGVVMPEPDFSLDGGAMPCYYAETVRAALNAPPPVQQVSVPDGWKWVPAEPTPEMLAAAVEFVPSGLKIGLSQMAAEDYRAMLASAPAAPAADAGLVEFIADIERDQQAQRIGELASHLEFAVTMLTVAGLAGNDQVDSMRAALSSGKEVE